jgi:multisubunit Na+/H+ antiporter MnhC subunit
MTGVAISTFALASGLALILIGLSAMLTHKNIIRMIIGFSLVDTGIHMVIVAIGYVTGGSAPIIDDTVTAVDAASRIVDPVPSALVLTAIVIGLAVTAVMLSFAVRIYRAKHSLSIDRCAESKW